MDGRISWASHSFAPVVHLPAQYEVLDLTGGEIPQTDSEFTIGKYDENRRGLYETELFTGTRYIHMGIDIGGPVGTPCYAFMDCEISHLGYNSAAGDYGYVIITRQVIDEIPVWALYGHLGSSSVEGKSVGDKFSGGDVLAWFGDREENGGWEPHLHFQLSYERPTTHDIPGVVSPEERERALQVYPDPRLVLGPLY